MGFFGSSAPSPAAPKLSTDGTPIAPNRTQRSLCWEGRDAYFACLDKNNIVDAVTDGAAASRACPAEEKGFEASCATSWVKYFKQRRVMERQKAETLQKLKLEGAEEMAPGVADSLKRGPK